MLLLLFGVVVFCWCCFCWCFGRYFFVVVVFVDAVFVFVVIIVGGGGGVVTLLRIRQSKKATLIKLRVWQKSFWSLKKGLTYLTSKEQRDYQQ